MSALLSLLASPRALGIVGGIVFLACTHGIVGAKAYHIGAERETAKWLAEKAADQRAALSAQQALQKQIAARDAEIVRKTEEAAHAVAEVHTEYLPGKTIVRREVVQVPAYRDCHVSDGVRAAIDGALAGHPVPGADSAEAVDRRADGVSR